MYRVQIQCTGFLGSRPYVLRSQLQEQTPSFFLAKVQNLGLQITLPKTIDNSELRHLLKRSRSLAQNLQDIIRPMERTINCHVKLELSRYEMVNLHNLADMRSLRVFTTVSVTLCHPTWQTSRPMFCRALDDQTKLESRQTAIQAIELSLGQGEREEKGPELTLIAVNFFV